MKNENIKKEVYKNAFLIQKVFYKKKYYKFDESYFKKSIILLNIIRENFHRFSITTFLSLLNHVVYKKKSIKFRYIQISHFDTYFTK